MLGHLHFTLFSKSKHILFQIHKHTPSAFVIILPEPAFDFVTCTTLFQAVWVQVQAVWMPGKEIWSSWVYKPIVFSLCPAHAAYGSFHGCWRAWLMGWRAAGLIFLMYSSWQGEVTWGKSKYIGDGRLRRIRQTATECAFMPKCFL